jgi:CBS domain containing-hemolysin-like protein
MNIPAELLVMLLCLLVQGFLNGIELGIVSVSRHRLHHLVRTGSRRARIIESYLHDTNRLFGTTLVGTCLTVVAISTLAGILGNRYGLGHAGQTLAAVLVSLVLLVFAEYLPKVWFNSRPIDRCLPFADVLVFFERLLRPLVRLVILLTRWASPPRHAEHAPSLFVTREHIQSLVQDSAAGGQISSLERLMINRALDLQRLSAADVMTPLKRIAHAHDETTLADCAALARQSGHMRLPVLDAEDGTCVGVLHLLDALARVEDPAAVPAREAMSAPFFVRPDVRADDLLPLMRRQRQPLALVRDDRGAVLGLVTQENIVSFLMGAPPPAAAGPVSPAGGPP